MYRIDPRTNEVTVFKIPHRDGDAPGGLLAARLKDFPRHDSTSNAHSLAQSAKDGHIFVTPSAQQRLVEFDPKTGAFTLHDIGGGFYPHTIRVDAQDRLVHARPLEPDRDVRPRDAALHAVRPADAGWRERLTVR